MFIFSVPSLQNEEQMQITQQLLKEIEEEHISIANLTARYRNEILQHNSQHSATITQLAQNHTATQNDLYQQISEIKNKTLTIQKEKIETELAISYLDKRIKENEEALQQLDSQIVSICQKLKAVSGEYGSTNTHLKYERAKVLDEKQELFRSVYISPPVREQLQDTQGSAVSAAPLLPPYRVDASSAPASLHAALLGVSLRHSRATAAANTQMQQSRLAALAQDVATRSEALALTRSVQQLSAEREWALQHSGLLTRTAHTHTALDDGERENEGEKEEQEQRDSTDKEDTEEREKEQSTDASDFDGVATYASFRVPSTATPSSVRMRVSSSPSQSAQSTHPPSPYLLRLAELTAERRRNEQRRAEESEARRSRIAANETLLLSGTFDLSTPTPL